jgi:hypothetical protein
MAMSTRGKAKLSNENGPLTAGKAKQLSTQLLVSGVEFAFS